MEEERINGVSIIMACDEHRIALLKATLDRYIDLELYGNPHEIIIISRTLGNSDHEGFFSNYRKKECNATYRRKIFLLSKEMAMERGQQLVDLGSIIGILRYKPQ